MQPHIHLGKNKKYYIFFFFLNSVLLKLNSATLFFLLLPGLQLPLKGIQACSLSPGMSWCCPARRTRVMKNKSRTALSSAGPEKIPGIIFETCQTYKKGNGNASSQLSSFWHESVGQSQRKLTFVQI